GHTPQERSGRAVPSRRPPVRPEVTRTEGGSVDARTVRRRGARPVALVAALLAAGGGLGCETGPAVTPADLVLTNGKVVTVDSLRPEAEAVAIAGDTIVAVGSSAEIARY